MIRYFIIVPIVFLGCSQTDQTDRNQTDSHAQWGYTTDTNLDSYWAGLREAYQPCKDGRHQSPINATQPTESDHSISISYGSSHESIENNGHTVKLKFDSGSWLAYDQNRYELLQFHFHTPSEHYVEGEQFPLEMHLVHARHDTVYLVLARFFKEGKENDFLNRFLVDVPLEESEIESSNRIDLTFLNEQKTGFLAYEGSFTTPPCTEGVKWLLSTEILEASTRQIKRLKQAEGENARDPHALFDRHVEKF